MNKITILLLNTLYQRLIYLMLISIGKPLIVFCGNNIDNQPEEANRDLLAFFEALPPHPNNVGLQATDTINQGTRFGWEYFAIFVVVSVLGYILIRHGADIYRGTKDFMLDLVQHTNELAGTVTREAVRQAGIRAFQNQENHTRIAQLIARRVQG